LAVLDEELHRLGERLRAPLVLCYLDGKTQDEAARQLGWSLRTFKRRLEQARACLRARLTPRGLALPAVLLPTAVSDGSAPARPPARPAATPGAARQPGGGAAAACAPAVLTRGVLRPLPLTRLQAAAVVLAAGVVALGVGALTRSTPASTPPAAAAAAAPP